MRSRTPHWLLLTILAGLGMVGPFSIDTIFPAFTAMEAEWGVSELALQQLVSVYLLSFAAMSLFHGPLSDALGRRPVILVSQTVYALASVACALSPDLGILLAMRALQGISAGGGMIIGRAIVRDLFDDVRAQRTMSHIAMLFGIAPALAPIVGGWILGASDWRGIFWFLAGFVAVVTVLVALWLPETHPPVDRTPLAPKALVAGLVQVWSRPAGRRLALNGWASFAGSFLYISAAPILVVRLLHLGEQDFWVLFVPLIGGMVLGSWVSGRLAGRIPASRIASIGYLVAVVGAAANFALAASGLPALPWAVAALPVMSFGISVAFPVLTLTMLEEFPHQRGAASSVQSFVQLLGNALLAGLVAPLLAGSLLWLATGALVVVVSAALMWQYHLRRSVIAPKASPDAPAYEPLDDI